MELEYMTEEQARGCWLRSGFLNKSQNVFQQKTITSIQTESG